jgi:hypothetical protein
MNEAVVDWLLDSDPAVRWQVMHDLLDRPEAEWRAVRASVETKGWGARLLEAQDEDGQWAGGAHFPGGRDWRGGEPGQPWTSTSHVLTLLRDFGIVPTSERMQRSVRLIGENCRWEHDHQPYWEGEVEPCINGQLVTNGTYFGVDMTPVVERLVSEVLDDGGWNCEVENGAVVSSFDTTINVIEGLLAHERAGRGTEASVAVRRSGEEYLLERALYKRRSTGEPADETFLALTNPSRWRHHVLRGLEHFRAASLLTGSALDERLSESIDWLRSRRLDDGRWPLDLNPPGRTWLDVDDGEGEPSRWVTLRALRILRWWESSA